MKNLKLVIVGSGAVGKTSFLHTLSSGSFPQYLYGVWDNLSLNHMYNGVPYNISLWDTAGQDDYDRLRPLSYPQTDIFLMVYSPVMPGSFVELRDKFIPEVNHHCPGTPFVIMSLKEDLKTDQDTLDKLVAKNQTIITSTDAKNLGISVGASGFFEISALTGQGMSSIVNNILSLDHKTPKFSFSPPQMPTVNRTVVPLSLQDTFSRVVVDPPFIDVKFTFPNGEVIHANKAILSLRCRRFQKLFVDHNFGEHFKAIENNNNSSNNSSSSNSSSNSNGTWYRYKKLTLDTAITAEMRHGQMSTLDGNTINIFTGALSNGELAHTMLQFDIDTEKVKSKGLLNSYFPSGTFHSISKYKEKYYIFGGKNNKYKNDILTFSQDLSFDPVKSRSTKNPAPRFGHTCVSSPSNNSILVFGGYDSEFGLDNGIYSFNVDLSEWRNIQVTDEDNVPFRRHYHYATCLHDVPGTKGDTMVIFGGSGPGNSPLDDLWLFDIQLRQWKEIKKTGTWPSPRYGMSGVEIGKNKIIFNGGITEKQSVLCDMWELTILSSDTVKWRNVLEESIQKEFLPRCFHTAHYHNDKIYLIGGQGGDRSTLPIIEIAKFGASESKQNRNFLVKHITYDLFKELVYSVYGAPAPQALAAAGEVNTGISETEIQTQFPILNFNNISDNCILLFPDAPYIDILINLQNGSVGAHKILLYANCTHFRNMLRKTPDIRDISLPDIDIDSFTKLQKYLYCGVPPKFTTREQCLKALKIAQDLSIPAYTQYVVASLFESVFSDTYAVLELATNWQLKELAAYVKWHMAINIEQFIEDPKFLALDVDLKNEILYTIWPNALSWYKESKKTGGKEKCVMQ